MEIKLKDQMVVMYLQKMDLKISATNFLYKNKNILNASGNVIIQDQINDYKIFSENIAYRKNDELIQSKGKTDAKIHSRYILESDDLVFLRIDKILESKKRTTIKDEASNTFYKLEKFNFNLTDEILKGEKILVNIDYNLPKNDKLYFENGMFNLKNKSYSAKDIEIKFKKDGVFSEENDPRLKGVYLLQAQTTLLQLIKVYLPVVNIMTIVRLGQLVQIKSFMIKNKKQMIYENALLKIYNIPVFYFPKFFTLIHL